MTLVLMVAATVCAAQAAEPPKFTNPPAATKARDVVKIEFATDRETDVDVTVADGKGAVVRHLVAGNLGKNPPPPLKPDSLAQSVAWDGKDDDGKPVAGEVKVLVRLGLGAKLDRFLPTPGAKMIGPANLKNADLKGLERLKLKVKAIYERLGIPDRCDMVVHNGVHEVEPVDDVADINFVKFLDRWLKEA